MSDGGSVLWERLGAVCLIVLSSTGMLWLRWEAAAVEAAASVRREQLDHLRTLACPRVAAAPIDPSALAALGGLLPGSELVWQRNALGTYLSVRAHAGAEVGR